MKNTLLMVFAFCVFMCVSCVGTYKFLPNGKLSVEKELTAFWNVGKYIDRVLLAKGFDKPTDHEADFWVNLILGVGMSVGGLLLFGGLLVIVFSELTKWKLGAMCSVAGLLTLASSYLLMRYWVILCIIVGIAILLTIGFVIYHLVFERDVTRRLIGTAEVAKSIPKWETLDEPTKAEIKKMLREIQGSKQRHIKKLHDKVIG